MREIMLKKKIMLSGIGILCLSIGFTYGEITRDRILIIMSIIICLINAYKIIELHRIEKNGKYNMVLGRCLEMTYHPVGRYRSCRLDTGGEEIDIAVPKSVKLKQNRNYMLYFKETGMVSENSAWLRNKALSDNFLGYEEIDSKGVLDKSIENNAEEENIKH